ncbi:MAG: redox-regulated ATPase YchF [Candidatus Glassbacteria bacterium]|nr:redox-regulated ATPase YchF [Candidatus Glassbacteria bacterium]
MKIGLIGYPLSGKTAVFNTLTGLHARTDSFHSAGKQANVGLIKVPDVRIDELSAIYKRKKTTYAEINFADFAGISADSGSGGFDSQSLSLMRQLDALAFVVRAFEDETVPNPRGRPDPVADVTGIEEELQLADLIVVENRQQRLGKEARQGTKEYELLEKCRAALEDGRPLRDIGLGGEEARALTGFTFLSLKPRLILVNTGEDALDDDRGAGEKFDNTITFCASVEQQIAELQPDEQQEFLEAMEISEPARPKFIRAAYGLMELISFFTVGDDEVKAWTIKAGTPAVEAAGKVHTDIQRGFIRAEVAAYDDYIVDRDMVKLKERGKLRLEGKNYVVQDGDIINFRFNV